MHGFANVAAIQPLPFEMASLTLTRPTLAFRLRGLTDASSPTTSPIGSLSQIRQIGFRRRTCEPPTHSTTRIPRCKGQEFSIPCHSTRLAGLTRGFASTTPKRTKDKAKGEQRKPRRGRPLTILAITILGAALLSASTDISSPFGRKPKGVLNSETFVPFQVVSTERTSPTTFILTVAALAPHRADNAAAIRDAWAHGLWSVEVKQPQLQIARNYTPLPPTQTTAGDDDGDGGPAEADHLRFLVRRYDGGEMSTYLSRLRPGDDVWLRGPHLGFDVAARLGPAGGRVVFLAGGTGVAPALQVARRALLCTPPPRAGGKLSVEIIWASRSRADCAGCPRLLGQRDGATGGGIWGRLASVAGGPAAPAGEQDPEAPEHPVVRELRELQAAYRSRGHELDFRCVADDEAGVISGADVTRAIECSRTPPPTAAGLPTKRAPCYYHSQQLLQHSTQESDAELKAQGGPGTAARHCACGGTSANGKNLLMISGPDGFVSAYVGPKVWADGAERQGPIGGLVRKLMQKSPQAWRDWLVLKQ